MSVNDIFPVDADYTVTRTKESNVLRAKLDSAREYFRQKAPPRRVFTLVFNRRPVADWSAIENFRLAHMTDFFSWQDKSANRYFSCYFDAEPVYEEVGHQQVNIRCQLIEAVGMALYAYPTFSDPAFPFVNIPLAKAQNLGGSGFMFVFAGYGYRVNGTFSQIFLNEVDTGGANPNEGVPLGLHRVRVAGGAPESLDYLI